MLGAVMGILKCIDQAVKAVFYNVGVFLKVVFGAKVALDQVVLEVFVSFV